MSNVRSKTAALALTGALLVGAVGVGSPAQASGTTAAPVKVQTGPEGLAPADLEHAIDEARAGGHVKRETTNTDGIVTTTIDLGEGFTFDLVRPAEQQRIGAGKDSKGTFVSFNATDQNMIISGSAFALGAAVCAVSAGTFCVVVGAVLTAATVAITGSGAIRCGTKQLRVYPFAGGKVKPRCA